MNSIILPTMGWIALLLYFLKDDFGIKKNNGSWYAIIQSNQQMNTLRHLFIFVTSILTYELSFPFELKTFLFHNIYLPSRLGL